MRYRGLALLAGAMIALMVAANGMLAARLGIWMSMLVIHLCGLATAAAILLLRRKGVSLHTPGTPWHCYLPGVGGVLTTALNNLCFEPLGAALMLAIIIVGQLLGSCLIDHFGWFGMGCYPFRAQKLAGFAAMALGLALMVLGQPAGAQAPQPLQALGRAPLPVYVALALATGVNLAFTSTLNASLGSRIGVFPGVAVNYLVGLAATAVCVAALGQWAWTGASVDPALLTGGMFGVLIVAVSNVVLPRISVVYSTVLMFVGQIAAGIAIDAAAGMPITPLKAAGCAAIAAGLLYNMRLDKRE